MGLRAAAALIVAAMRAVVVKCIFVLRNDEICTRIAIAGKE